MRNIITFAIIAALSTQGCSSGEGNKAEEKPGQNLYEKNCTICHGKDGKLMAAGAKDLSISILNEEETLQAIEKGSPEKGMPAYGPRFKPQELEDLKKYVLSLRAK